LRGESPDGKGMSKKEGKGKACQETKKVRNHVLVKKQEGQQRSSFAEREKTQPNKRRKSESECGGNGSNNSDHGTWQKKRKGKMERPEKEGKESRNMNHEG